MKICDKETIVKTAPLEIDDDMEYVMKNWKEINFIPSGNKWIMEGKRKHVVDYWYGENGEMLGDKDFF